MEQCWYCTVNQANQMLYNKPICDECRNHDFRAILPPRRDSEEDKAFRWKLFVSMEKIAEEQRNGTRERSLPDGL